MCVFARNVIIALIVILILRGFQLRVVCAVFVLRRGYEMRLVVIESPYSGDIEKNEKYARECMRDCILRGEAPIASHLLYTQPLVLDENIQTERSLGIAMGFAWGRNADAIVFYTDFGMSRGMTSAVEYYEREGINLEYRTLK